MNSSTSRRAPVSRTEETKHFHEVKPLKGIRREPVLWATDPMSRNVNFGPVPQLLATRTITWYDNEHEHLATSVVIYNDRGEEVSEFRAAFGSPIDPILAHRLHRLIAALKFVSGQQLALATAAVTNKTPYVLQDGEFDPANAELELRSQLCEGYDVAVQHLSNDVAGDIKRIRDCNCEVSTVMVTEECISGRLAFSDQLAALGVESPQMFADRKAARAALLDPLKQHIDLLLDNGQGPVSCNVRESFEGMIVMLAKYGVTDQDLLLGCALNRHLDMVNMEAAQGLQDRVSHGVEGIFFNFFHSMMPLPDTCAAAAKQVHAMGINSMRDETWLRYGIDGIMRDIKNRRLTVKRNDL